MTESKKVYGLLGYCHLNPGVGGAMPRQQKKQEKPHMGTHTAKLVQKYQNLVAQRERAHWT
jgi:hypothetical protein